MNIVSESAIVEAVARLKSGGLVVFPTETVYGLGANARDPDAVAKIFALKNRPQTNPVIVHLAKIAQISEWAIDIPDDAYILAQAYWPGPLTLVLKKHPSVDYMVTAKQELVALRIPNHPAALALLTDFGDGVAAPSANRFGRISPTTVSAVADELSHDLPYIIVGGQCSVGIESTIIDLSADHPTILRPGQITSGAISKLLQRPVVSLANNTQQHPGKYKFHYAPTTQVILVALADMALYLKQLRQDELPLAVLARANTEVCANDGITVIPMPVDPGSYAHALYSTLRLADQLALRQLVIELPPDDEEWFAVHDRLNKAAGGNYYVL